MILGNEIRAGNLVIYHRKEYIVDSVFIPDNLPNDTGVHLRSFKGNAYDLNMGQNAGDLEPFPILSEYLLRLGFVDTGKNEFTLEGFIVIVNEDDTQFVYNENHIHNIEGFHQLQNHFSDFKGGEDILLREPVL